LRTFKMSSHFGDSATTFNMLVAQIAEKLLSGSNFLK
jgi:hypothetical protein